MNKKDIKKLLISLETPENQKKINYILGRIDSLSEEKLLSLVSEIGTDEESILKYFKDKLKESSSEGRENKTFSQIKITLEKVLKLLEENNLTLYISGGIVPYILLNQDSNRLHDDIDTICKLEDIEKLRELFKTEGFYNPDWDSKNYTQDGIDYGFEMEIEGVPFGIYPFEYKDGTVTQYSFDPYNKKCKTKTIQIEEITDYIYSYRGKNGKTYNTMSLEYIKLTKDYTKRPKDIEDSKKISEYGIRKDIISRLSMYKVVPSR